MRHALASTLLLLCSCAPAPQPPADPRRDAQADLAFVLFMESCVTHLTKPQELSDWIRSRQLRAPDPPIAARILAGEQGEVWSASSSMGEFFLIVVAIDQTSNKCAVWAPRANAARLTEHFERLLKASERPGLRVDPISDREIEGVGGTYRQLVYFSQQEGAELGWVFIATTSASEQAEIQGRLTVSPGLPPASEHP